MALTPQLIILGQMVHYISSDGDRFAAIVTKIIKRNVVDLYVLYNESDPGHVRGVVYDPYETVRGSWHTTLCTGCKRMAVGYEKKDGK